ncbi:hypothetical protein [Paracoccus sulfuroxidans]|uniref:Uncharacterized protein n=1 Tax=Paracoccus sulfuroxidans TaxID=384678 RepID=A0A562NQR6_9RHOB|nr:hypothetical protein [Paracoccus sulfuroxidans]TWI34410.1 hypothetical protein IQ24_01928 [Paracoccus sulfuroxidans]
MPAQVCFWINGEKHCIDLYAKIRRWPPDDPWPLRIDDILTFPEIGPAIIEAAEPHPVPWLTKMGLDAPQQQALGSMIRVWDAAQNLPAKARDQIGEILNAGAKDFGLGEGANLSFSTDMAR